MRAHSRWLWFTALLLLFINLPLINVSSTPVVHPRATVSDLLVYGDSLTSQWKDWSYFTTVAFNSGVPHSGTAGISVKLDKANGALSLHIDPPLSGTDYGSISFWVKGDSSDSNINFFLGDDAVPDNIKEITAPEGVWKNFDIPLSELGSPANFARLNWQGTDGVNERFFVDDIAIKAATSSGGIPDSTSDGSRTIDPGPSGVAVAPSGRVYVTSYHADIVYSWSSVANMLSTDIAFNAPDKVFGDSQTGDPDSDTGCAKNDPSATILCGPESIAVDSKSNLFVADTYHHRILVFLNPDTDATPTTADVVLGQANFTDADPDFDANGGDGAFTGLCYVRGLAVDSSDRLWAVDEGNYRVIRYDTPLTSGSLPNRVFGQSDLNAHAATCDPTKDGGAGATQLGLPLGVAVDQEGNVFVTDFNNSRIQRFAADAANGAAAEASYTTDSSGIDHAHDVAIDAAGDLYAANTFKGEVLVFEGGANGDLTSDDTFPNLNYPMGLVLTAKGDLLVADCGVPKGGVADYPPCVSGVAGERGVFFFAASPPPTFSPPDAQADSVATAKETAFNGNVLTNDTDPQGSALTVSAHTDPQHGTVTIKTNGDFTYTPNPGYTGPDSFTYTAKNGHNLTDTATVTIDVTNEQQNNQPPNAVNDSFQTKVNTKFNGNVLTNDTDPQGSALTVSAHTDPQHGTVTINTNGDFTYTPNQNYVGQDSFTYTAANTQSLKDTGTVTVNVVAAQGAQSKLFVPALKR